MIVGIGTDIVAVARMHQGLTRWGERFAARVLAAAELEELRACAQPANFLAKRFAVKEATAKAFGTGFRDGLALRHIAVAHQPSGRPLLCFSGRAAELAERLGVGESFVSVSDEREFAVAFVVLTRADSGACDNNR